MGIIVNGPYSGQPVKVRDQDVGRAVKDEEGRVFYVLQKSDGSGYYGAMTRAGGAKDEARALELEGKLGQRQQNVHEQVLNRTGNSGGGMKKIVVLIIVLAILLGAAWAVLMGPLKGVIPGTGGSSNTTPATPAPAPVPSSALPTLMLEWAA